MNSELSNTTEETVLNPNPSTADETISTEPNETPKTYSKKAMIFGGIGVSILFCLLYFGLQVGLSTVLTSIYTFIAAFRFAFASGGADTAQMMESINESLTTGPFMTILLFICTMGSALPIALWYYLAYGRKKTHTLKVTLKGFINVTVAAIAMYASAVIIALITEALFPAQGELFEELMSVALGGSPVFAFITTVILAPIGEESLLRGLVMKQLEKYGFSVAACIIIQGIFFGIIHMNLIQGIYAIPIGILYGFVAYKTKSILPSIYMHMINNFLATIVGYLPEQFSSLAVTLPVFVIATVAAVLIYKSGSKDSVAY